MPIKYFTEIHIDKTVIIYCMVGHIEVIWDQRDVMDLGSVGPYVTQIPGIKLLFFAW